MSFEYRAASAAAQRFRSHLKATASTRVHALVPVSLLAAVAIAGTGRDLIPSTPGVRASAARTPIVAPADRTLGSSQATRAAHERWQSVARRACEEMRARGGPAAVTPYSLCVRRTLVRWYEDSGL